MMKHKQLLCIALATISSLSFALTTEERAQEEIENMKILAEKGLPLPDSGIQIVPRHSLKMNKETLARGKRDSSQIKKIGYVSTYNKQAQELLGFKTMVHSKKLLSTTRLPPTSTALRSSVRAIPLGFEYNGMDKGFQALHGIEFIAATPMGGFHDEVAGWSGVAEFFNAKDIGSCSYSLMNVKTSHTAAQLAEEDVTYIINQKPTLSRIEGNNNSGFLYHIEWFDDQNFHELECANMKYSSGLNDSVIELAKAIDNH